MEERRLEKELFFERQVLQTLCLTDIEQSTRALFASFTTSEQLFEHTLVPFCTDVALESYLYGARFSRLHRVMSDRDIKRAWIKVENEVVAELLDFLLYWCAPASEESLVYSCEHYIDRWWSEGYLNGMRRWRLRLWK
ncbi:uncharacterized protein DUF2521 [Aureibacillus halotolerans]|uniref:Uncharacterized protein DUF2521 n=2 Tax=Aureibacillus halotolerans TaxID=1508390 RepID=A0A4V3D4D8_9BACI|nr:uncharacterized protein DUF2521 [Aureibacillus halotolerans]